MKTENDVAAAVRGMAKIYDKGIEAETIAFYTEVLLGVLTPDEACSAIARWAASEPRWPAPAQIIHLLKPKQEARDIAGELAQDLLRLIAQKGYTWEATFRYDGYTNIEEAILCEVGEEAVAVVRRSGGWSNFCREWGGEQGDGTARAQLRGLCESAVKTTTAGGEQVRLPGPMGSRSLDPVGEFIAHQKALKSKREVPQ